MLLGCVMLAKCVATALTVGSGASGGVLGPSVFIGGAAGAFLGAVIEAAYPGTFPEPMRQALIPVGMGGVLAASMRTPMAAIVMVTEMTGSYGLIVPLMVVCVSAYVVGRRWGLNHEQVRSMAESPAHAGDAVVHMLESWRVEQLMDRAWAETATPEMSLGELVERIELGTQPVFAVVRDERLQGVIRVSDIQRIIDEPGLADAVIAADMMDEHSGVLYPDQDVYQALTAFEHGRYAAVPVVSRDRERHWLGMLTRQRVYEAVQHQVADMQARVLREHKGLAAMEQEGQLHQLMMGVTPHEMDRIQRLLVPLQAIGRSLREVDFRQQFGVHVIAIEQADGSVQCPADPDAPLRTDQRLVAIVRDRPHAE
jgi:CIC family chloride channel protein